MFPLSGRVTGDATVRTTKKGKEYVSFSIADNYSYRNKQGEKMQETTYFRCVFYGSTNIAPYITKGTVLQVWGQAKAYAYEIGGETRAEIQLKVRHLELLSKKQNSSGAGNGSGQPESNASVPAGGGNKKSNKAKAGGPSAETSDDLPF